ncbi:UNVERIFIED_CONTAM: protein HOTHEAD [Sesamum radiatum]|uniref:Protein HOTHEAD n=1 Tax=Sesamum radiatum TaxID=300843 RepID=A0AAW2U8F3_SESRA
MIIQQSTAAPPPPTTAGCPSRPRSPARNYTVLLLERGGAPFANLNVSLMQNFHIALADISPTSASQMFISTDNVSTLVAHNK